MDDTTNPAAPEVDAEALPGDGEANDVQDELATSEQSDGAETQDEPEADDAEDVDFEGKKYRVPKDIKDALLRHSDYTRKTQEVAEERRRIESERTQVQQLAKLESEHLDDIANLRMVEGALQRFQSLNWQQLIEQDPVEALKQQTQFNQAASARQQLVERISQRQQQRGLQQQQEIAKRVQEAEAALASDDKGWTASKSSELSAYVQKEYGFSVDELAQAMSPKFARLMRDAMTGRKAIQSAISKPKPSEPVKPVTVLKSSKPAAQGLHDGLSAEEWMRRRNAQLRNRK